MTSPDKATVFIVDNDDRMRAATQRLRCPHHLAARKERQIRRQQAA